MHTRPIHPGVRVGHVEGGTTPERPTEMNRIVTDELLPALEAEPGYAGAINLATRQAAMA